MVRFQIAGLQVNMNCGNGILADRAKPYKSNNDSEADITVDIDEAFIEKMHQKYPNLSFEECRYVWSGECFYSKLLDFDGILLHASCIEKDGLAYMFSAKSGTGKSTHTHLWMKVFNDVTMINDDKPALRIIDEKVYACGTPFSGKNDESTNIMVPARAIVFVERAQSNSIQRLEAKDAIPRFLGQTIRPTGAVYMDKMLSVLDRILKTVPTFLLKCNMDDDAAKVAYSGIEEYIKSKEE